jgi:hypothetical protein
MKWFKKIQKWNALIKFIIKCKERNDSLGKFQILTTGGGLYYKLKIIIIELDKDGKTIERIEFYD